MSDADRTGHRPPEPDEIHAFQTAPDAGGGGRHLRDLEEIYPPEVVAEIERRGRPSAPRGAAGLRRRAVAGGLAAGLLLGVREALEPEPERPAVVEVDPGQIPAGEGVRLVLVPGAPAASRAWVTSAAVG